MDTLYVLVDIDNPPAELNLKVGQLLALYRIPGGGATRLSSANVPSENFSVRQPRFGEVLPGQPDRSFIVSLHEAVACGVGTLSLQFASPELFGAPLPPQTLQFAVRED